MTLISRCACVDGCGTPILPRGMSVGSFMLLLLVIFVAVYLVVGYLYRRFVIGARGIELLPHLSFWMDFPLLVRVSSCLGSYGQIGGQYFLKLCTETHEINYIKVNCCVQYFKKIFIMPFLV